MRLKLSLNKKKQVIFLTLSIPVLNYQSLTLKEKLFRLKSTIIDMIS